ncbi:MAG: molybdopterin-synthase adenylyltransferase MoeB [Polyangiaceae bacterium]|jgi:molybdopterin/thiamine biosynthesis adenylyltransferase/rhodanese-related sulfurtransferase|nr:molybdopterin-synthase adenylyltransferase MoeB [Polyangiaceae bacterium]
MATTYNELIEEARRQVRLVPLDELRRRLEARAPMVLVDVREREETRAGTLPGALIVPRGLLELEIESKVPDRGTHVVLYCAGGVRSALAARTLRDLGYTNVESADPGFVRWKELGYPVEARPQLTDAQRDRYARHLLLPEVGESGQAKLLGAKVLLLGAGGLGSPAALYLAAAGVGTLGLVDSDVVEASNLQRQILHATSRIGAPKVDSAERAVSDLNPDVKVVKFEERLTSRNVDRIFEGFDLVIDGSDNFPTRYLANDASIFHKKPVVHGSIFRFEGQVTVFHPAGGGPCYRCLYPEPPPRDLAPSCQEAGVLGILPGVIGVIQATEAVKLILGRGAPLVGRLLIYDSLRMRFDELRLRKDKLCPACGESPTIREYIDYEGFCAA